MEESKKSVLRKAAHRKALARLAKIREVEYKILLGLAHIDGPELKDDAAVRTARSTLRKRHPKQFRAIYKEEQRAIGLRPERDYERLGKLVLSLYGDGKGPTIRAISEKLGVSYTFAKRTIRDAGIRPRPGRKKEQ